MQENHDVSLPLQLAENLWYPLLDSNEIKHKPQAMERLGLKLVAWRSADGQVHIHPDRCPHLGAALSGGQVCDDRLVCPFHGIEFDGDGQCRHIPALGRNAKLPKGMQLKRFNVREEHGFIWLWWGSPQTDYPEVPFFSVLQEEGWRYGTEIVDWPVHYTRAIENQLDVAHLPFVHRTTIGAGGRTLVEGPYVEADLHSIKIWVTNKRDDGVSSRHLDTLAAAAKTKEPGLTFLFPGVWLLNIQPRLKNLVAFVPINAQTTRYYLRVYHRNQLPVVAWLFEKVMGLSNRYILNQDKRVVVTQTPQNSLEAEEDRLIAADRAINQFRRLQKQRLEQSPSSLND